MDETPHSGGTPLDPLAITAAPLDQTCVDGGAESMVDLRSVVTHLIEETARHAGHADILRELIDGATGR